ncbi:hypothetical protein RCH17_002978 [Arthrobacter sp. MP_M7]|nr:hypothetical protein [Arthrobacter sp. MP_M4]MEC5204159.1 hypothetical protein [Arthrobacter sp. MP_M7]
MSEATVILARVKSRTERLDIVGSNSTTSLDQAAAYYQQVAREMTDKDDPETYFGNAIANARDALEECLRGYDSFDTLAFLRFAAGPWDFTEVRESESQLENSQAAQDVVALTLLGMGLPRLPLTGENSGQPNPPKALRLAADIVTAARTRALLRGGRSLQPLGALAGEFVGYELSVRGRQYESIATELNTEHLGHPTVATITKNLLGFTLEDIRAVREASTALMNERFFGARDRIGEASQKGANTDPEAFLHDMNLMLNECRLFGAVVPSDVADRAGIEEPTTRAVLDFFSASRPAEDDPNPVMKFAMGACPAPWGSIADDGEYLILNGFLGEDELRRDIERGLIAATTGRRGNAGKLWPKYDKRRAVYSESKAAGTLSRLLNGAEPQWVGQKYIGPVSLNDVPGLSRDADRTAIPAREFESDLLFVVDGVALCVEVKAGSIHEKSRAGNATRLATDLQKTLKEGNEQADRLTQLIAINRGVWSAEGSWIDLASVCEVHSIVVMLDDMGPLSLSMNELAHKGIIDSEEVPWIVSMHDLMVISRTVDHPAQFLEYLRRRRGRKLATMVNGVDELDMFMWFLNGGMYFDPDPREIADQIPTGTKVKASELRRYEEQPRVRLGTLTDPLDGWFYSQEGLSRSDAQKPTRREQPWVEQYLSTGESVQSPGWLRFGADLVGLSEKAQRDIGKGLKEQCRRARGSAVERSLTTHSAASHGSWLLTLAVVPQGATTEHLPEYMEAKQYQTRSSRSMLLLYEDDGSLTGSHYRDRPEARTADRDRAIDIAPLRSLPMTFSKLPPSARRSTVRLRSKRGNKKR